MIYHPNWDTWRVKRSAINNYTGTTDINWAVLSKVGCAVKKTRVGDRSDASTRLCDPMPLTVLGIQQVLNLIKSTRKSKVVLGLLSEQKWIGGPLK